jgi:hypothetical protein
MTRRDPTREKQNCYFSDGGEAGKKEWQIDGGKAAHIVDAEAPHFFHSWSKNTIHMIHKWSAADMKMNSILQLGMPTLSRILQRQVLANALVQS